MSAPDRPGALTAAALRGPVRMAHGSGGEPSWQLIEELFAASFASAPLREPADAALLELPPDAAAEIAAGGRLAFATDGHTVRPLRFPGGDIGRLAVAGTVNDLAVMGARPLWLSAAFVLEEGAELALLAEVVASMKATADEAGVEVVAGDTKVVERGHGDGIYIATSGVGVVPPGRDLRASRVAPGDRLLVSGTLGDHGVAVLSQREGFALELDVESDVAPLGSLVGALLDAAPGTRFARDLTRGGLAAVANELVRRRPFGVRIYDAAVPLHPDVEHYSAMLGIDPLRMANEGKLLAAVPPEETDAALAALRAHPRGRRAAVVGDVVREPRGVALIETAFGSRRVLEMPLEEQLPRIC